MPKISLLPAGNTSLDGTELAPIVQNGATVRVPVSSFGVGVTFSLGRLSTAGAVNGQAITLVNGVPTWTTLAAGTTYSGSAPVSVSNTGVISITAASELSAGVVRIGTEAGTVAAGDDERIVNAVQIANIPGASGKILGGSGTDGVAIEMAIGAGLAVQAPGGVPTLVNTGGGGGGSVTVIENTYTASGTIDPDDDVAFVDSSVTATMVLAPHTVDLKVITVKRWGAGTVVLQAKIDGVQTSINLTSSAIKESLTLRWHDSKNSWVLV